MRQTARLKLAEVPEERSSGSDCRRVAGLEPEAIERGEAEPARELLAGEVGVELPGLAVGEQRRRFREPVSGRAVGGGRHDLRRCEAGERFAEGCGPHRLQHEFARAQVDRRNAGRVAVRHRHDPVVLVAGNPAIRQQRAGRDRLDHLAPHDTLGQLRVFDLLADRDAMAGRDELFQVLGGRLHRHAGEGDAVPARRECDVEDPGTQLGIVEEHLVEVAHPEEENRSRVTGLDLPVLLHEGRGPFRHPAGHGPTTNAWPPSLARMPGRAAAAAARVGYAPTLTL